MLNKISFETICKPRALLDAWRLIKQKGSSGGIDGVSIAEFDKNLDKHITQLQNDLQQKSWMPEPYFRINIPKKSGEQRKLGLLSIRDKIVQQAIKILIEPVFEKIFISNSYGYRPNKGHTRAIKFAKNCCQNKKYPIVLRLDIDNYFDTVNHDILFKRLESVIADPEILRLIQLSIKMGVVDKKLNWEQVTEGVPSGAVLSPIIANYYLHSFDQFVLSRTKMYVRYADDFIICCESQEQAQKILLEATTFLEERLKLKLNPPVTSETKDGFEFLGITLTNKTLTISEKKREDLSQRLKDLVWCERTFSKKGIDAIRGIHRYYAKVLPQSFLQEFDHILITRLHSIIKEQWNQIPNKTTLLEALNSIEFYSDENFLKKKTIRNEIIELYLEQNRTDVRSKNLKKNKKAIAKRKREYQQKENEASELVINTQGSFIGVNSKGITLKIYGKQQAVPPSNNLKHITVLCNGVSISSNAISYCMQNKITIDYFSSIGQHIGSILSNKYMKTSLWEKQSLMGEPDKCKLGKAIIIGKIRNQMSLIKYFHKYHKNALTTLSAKYDEIIPKIELYIDQVKGVDCENYREQLIHIEATSAALYWSYIRELISDDDIGFTHRERQGATDLFNCMLNYGYAILYARIWQAVLKNKLNPHVSVVHVQHAGKPTFVYDIIELFRSQAVDRVVISLIQKKQPLKMSKGLLDNTTKQLLVKNILERINRYEKYRSKELRLSDIIVQQVKEIADFIENNTNYKPYVSKW